MLCVVGLTVFLPSQRLRAQSRSATPSASAMDTTSQATLATITTDTGAFAPGHRDFSRYNTPGLCRAAARETRAGFQFGVDQEVRLDTLYIDHSNTIPFTGRKDTVGAGATTPVARACGARFTLVGATTRVLNDLFDLALHEQNDSLAQAVLTKLAAQAATAKERDGFWRDGFQTMLNLGRRAAAEALMARFDAQGPAARADRVWFHARMQELYKAEGDTARLRTEIAQVIALGRKDSGSSGNYGAVLQGYRDLMALAVAEALDSIPTVAHRAQRDLSPFTAEDQHGFSGNDTGEWSRYSMDSLLTRLAPEWYTLQLLRGHRVAPRLQADSWFPAPGEDGHDTIRPVPSKVNVLCLGWIPMSFYEDVMEHGGPSGRVVSDVYARRWLQRYQAAGVVFTVVHQARGHLGYEANTFDGDTYDFVTTPADEARIWRWYTQEFHQQPVAVAVQVRHEDWLPEPDGRRWSESAIQFEQYMSLHSDLGRVSTEDGACAVIGRDGMILYDWPQFAHNEVGTVLDWLLWGPGASRTSPSLQPATMSPGAPARVPSQSHADTTSSAMRGHAQ